jgi:hypothetical protein
MSEPTTDQIALLAKRRVENWVNGFGGGFARLMIDRWWSWVSQFLFSPDLSVGEFGPLTTTNVVITAVACTLYLIWITAPTATAGWFKATDNATTCTTSGAQDISVKHAAIGEIILAWSKGFSLANGLTLQGNTTATGSTAPATADQVSGFVIFG